MGKVNGIRSGGYGKPMNRILLATLALSLGAAAAHAQLDFFGEGSSFRAGFVYPTDDNVRDATGNMFGLGVDVNVPFSLLRGQKGFLSLDYMSSAIDGGKGYILPIMFNQRFELGQGIGGRSAYFYVGAGFVNADFDRADTVFGLRGGVGVNLGERNFLEVSYLWPEKLDGARVSTLGVYYGWKF